LMSTFDAANPNACTAKRPETTVPQQTLFALNSEFIQDRAARLAAIIKQSETASDDEKIDLLFHRILSRHPTSAERDLSKQFLTSLPPETTAPDLDKLWAQLAHALLASNEFTFLD